MIVTRRAKEWKFVADDKSARGMESGNAVDFVLRRSLNLGGIPRLQLRGGNAVLKRQGIAKRRPPGTFC